MPPAPPTILIVEDDAALRDFLAQLFEDAGYAVLIARDGREAVQIADMVLLASAGVCAILLDLMLPALDGTRVLQHLREQGQDVPVVAMSASPRHLNAARAAGATATLPKPFDLKEVLALVEAHCGPAR